MKKGNLILALVIFNVSLTLEASPPSVALEGMNTIQQAGNELLVQENGRLKGIKALIKDNLYLSTSEIVFLLQQRNKLIFNENKIEALEQGE